MLYDPKWEVKTKRPIDRLIAWLEQQPPEMGYDFAFPRRCLVAQWLLTEGAQNYCLDVPELHAMIGQGGSDAVAQHPQTFGAALDRLRNAE